jgi:hypothetical protein
MTSQQTLNCALSVDFLWKEDLGSDNTSASEVLGNESQITQFRLGGIGSATFPATAGYKF